ncbi:hypothetical protein M427DRAFT_57153 [Gonapodya prolifera JEL478]|uniref:Cerato-platanin n=1 Tax=Gonapodya prolifera (strain JEL478) TaxID=1344416 RepID=A0A139ADW3_GONPJ|nr:hypothetical protein M427DRAFT_57153 [Gonapodya prolifera JEL478]|eukprot:KXS15016.1 hypothetical protein M427DRAFT_57153 [Gonapodya prolifera JEL478]
MYPAVSAASFTVWNSPECGACWALLNPANGVTVNVTIVDGCGPVAGYANHFDISPDAFTTLGGQAAVNVGHIIVEKYSKISEKPCGT